MVSSLGSCKPKGKSILEIYNQEMARRLGICIQVMENSLVICILKKECIQEVMNNMVICIQKMENKMDSYMLMMACRCHWRMLQPLRTRKARSL